MTSVSPRPKSWIRHCLYPGFATAFIQDSPLPLSWIRPCHYPGIATALIQDLPLPLSWIRHCLYPGFATAFILDSPLPLSSIRHCRGVLEVKSSLARGSEPNYTENPFCMCLVHVKSVVAHQTSSCWCGANVWRGCRSCCPRRLTMVQSYEFH
ncbi:hypothetical protein AVEN_12221-1 [Araneus ventricosus]|uniref:Uncharacterized protein n=1 Tax=Araneus ventricosus TaxID=182803 RepID=A0A4Y2HZM8_ARAVE|nr:hypothetical protein AVEN_12221-1 [Araneus ventricosus]